MLSLAMDAMASDYGLWRCYFNDFVTLNLKLVDQGTTQTDQGEFAQQILHTFFEHLNDYEAPRRMAELHCYASIYQMNLAQIATILRPLSKIEMVRNRAIEFMHACYTYFCVHSYHKVRICSQSPFPNLLPSHQHNSC